MDLEVDPKTARIFDMAAVRFGDGPAVVAPKGEIGRGLDALEKATEKFEKWEPKRPTTKTGAQPDPDVPHPEDLPDPPRDPALSKPKSTTKPAAPAATPKPAAKPKAAKPKAATTPAAKATKAAKPPAKPAAKAKKAPAKKGDA